MMNKLASVVLVVCAILAVIGLLAGCATAPTPNPTVEAATAGAIGKCHEARASIETARIGKINDPKDLLLDRAITGLAEAAGKGVDPCRITTNNDLQKVAMEENTKQIVAAVDGGKSVAGNAVVGLLGWKFIDVMPALFGGGTGGTYNLTSTGDMTLSDSLKTSTLGDVTGTNQLGGILSNPSTAEPFVFTIPQ